MTHGGKLKNQYFLQFEASLLSMTQNEAITFSDENNILWDDPAATVYNNANMMSQHKKTSLYDV